MELALDQAAFVAVYVFELRPRSPRLLVRFLAELDPALHSSLQVVSRCSWYLKEITAFNSASSSLNLSNFFGKSFGVPGTRV